MTRAYINIRPKDSKKYLIIYHNGDQYLSGVVKHFGFRELLNPNGLTRAEVMAWFKKYYGQENMKFLEESNKATFDSLTDWNYRIDYLPYSDGEPVLECEIYNWGESVIRTYKYESVKDNIEKINKLIEQELKEDQ